MMPQGAWQNARLGSGQHPSIAWPGSSAFGAGMHLLQRGIAVSIEFGFQNRPVEFFLAGKVTEQNRLVNSGFGREIPSGCAAVSLLREQLLRCVEYVLPAIAGNRSALPHSV